VLQPVPFEKTPTLKIKRFLYYWPCPCFKVAECQFYCCLVSKTPLSMSKQAPVIIKQKSSFKP
jgi:hypothetical protein